MIAAELLKDMIKEIEITHRYVLSSQFTKPPMLLAGTYMQLVAMGCLHQGETKRCSLK
jgi:hypothetical protein